MFIFQPLLPHCRANVSLPFFHSIAILRRYTPRSYVACLQLVTRYPSGPFISPGCFGGNPLHGGKTIYSTILHSSGNINIKASRNIHFRLSWFLYNSRYVSLKWNQIQHRRCFQNIVACPRNASLTFDVMGLARRQDSNQLGIY